jgi:hypothetical protein
MGQSRHVILFPTTLTVIDSVIVEELIQKKDGSSASENDHGIIIR